MCLEEFDTLDALVSHKTNAHRRIQCTHCPDLKLVVDLNKHLRTTHGILQNSMCEHCGQVYTNTRSLQVNSNFQLDHVYFVFYSNRVIWLLLIFFFSFNFIVFV